MQSSPRPSCVATIASPITSNSVLASASLVPNFWMRSTLLSSLAVRSRFHICDAQSIEWIKFWNTKMETKPLRTHMTKLQLWQSYEEIVLRWMYKMSVVGLLSLAAFAGSRTSAHNKKGSTMSTQERIRVRAPEIAGGRGWLNTDKPLTLAALKGKVVLLDFWTYGCINCIHIIPDLKKLEAKYANQLVVIGVHSAKFQNEKETENIRRIILRYEIEHPVYNDSEYAVWQSYGVRAWPTQVLIDPAGYIIGGVSGEGNYDVIDQVIAKVADEFRKKGELNEEPLKLVLERAKVGDLPLAFPGKIVADAASDRLFIADSNHNRVVITKLDGTLVDTCLLYTSPSPRD